MVKPPFLQCKVNTFFGEMQIGVLRRGLGGGERLLHLRVMHLGKTNGFSVIILPCLPKRIIPMALRFCFARLCGFARKNNFVCFIDSRKRARTIISTYFAPFLPLVSDLWFRAQLTPSINPGLMALSPFRGIMQPVGLILFEQLYIHRFRDVYRTAIVNNSKNRSEYSIFALFTPVCFNVCHRMYSYICWRKYIV